MLGPIKHILDKKRIVLASGSPRRQELMRNIGVNVELCPSTFEENLNPNDYSNYDEFVEQTALGKALEVYERLSENNLYNPPDIVIAADTMVTLSNKLFGKPKTPSIAFRMLTELMNKTHTVYTGVVLIHSNGEIKFTESCDVTFGKATPQQIQNYVDSGEPLDKAGGYGIQGIGGTFIEKIDGDYSTVVGLPLYRLSTEICKLFNYEIN